jgi:hypothetical protein
LWRLAVFLFVFGGAALCTAFALNAGLRKTDVASLRVE